MTIAPAQVTGTAVVTNDARLSDARTPTSHGHTSGEVSGLGGAAVLAVGTTTGTVAAGDDSRITGAVQKSTATTKGDLLAATGSATVSRLGVGTNDYVLTAASGEATGMKWAAVPAAAVTSVNTATGAVVLDSDDIDDSGKTHQFATAAQLSKIDGVEASADVTDATNVAAAGAVMGTLIDAKGDLIVGSAADAAARLAVGTNDHVLTADSSATNGVKWAAVSGGSGIAETLLDAKGDLIAASAADTAAKVTVGVNGTVLTAASGASAGVTWSPPTLAVPRRTNAWHGGPISNVVGTCASTSGTLYCIPYYASGESVDAMYVKLSTGGAAGTLVRLGIYANTTDCVPGTLLVDAGTASAASNGNKIVTFTSTPLPHALVWLVAVNDDSAIVYLAGNSSVITHNGLEPLGDFNTNGDHIPQYAQSFTEYTTGALPATATTAGRAATTGNAYPVLKVRAV